MATVFRPSNGIWQGSTTATTGGTVTLDIVATTGKLNFRDRYANGATGVPLQLYDATSGIYEFSYGTLTYGGGGAGTDTISARVITYSTNGPATPVAWGAGTRNAWCNVAAESLLCAENALAEMTSIQLASALTRLGVVFGTSAGNTVRLDPVTAKYPAADGSQITGLPASPIPSGSKLAFYQAAAPAGWTLITTLDDTVMFVTNGSGITGGGPHAGGTTAANTWDPAPTFTIGARALTRSDIPISASGAAGSAVDVISAILPPASSHNHTITSSSVWRPPAAYFILCSKN